MRIRFIISCFVSQCFVLKGGGGGAYLIWVVFSGIRLQSSNATTEVILTAATDTATRQFAGICSLLKSQFTYGQAKCVRVCVESPGFMCHFCAHGCIMMPRHSPACRSANIGARNDLSRKQSACRFDSGGLFSPANTANVLLNVCSVCSTERLFAANVQQNVRCVRWAEQAPAIKSASRLLSG